MDTPPRPLRETEALLDAAKAILGAPDLQAICQELTFHFNRLVQAHWTVIYLVDHVVRTVVLSIYNGQPTANKEQITYTELEQDVSGQVFRSGRPCLSTDPDDGIEPEITRERRRQNGTGALIIVPLIARGQVIGTITAANLLGQRIFTQHDVDLLMALATQAGAAIDNVRLLAEAKRQVARWENISALSEVTSLQLDEPQLFELLYRQTLRLTRVPEALATFFLARYEPEPETLLFNLHYEWGQRLPPNRLRLGEGLSSWVVRHNRPLRLDDLLAQQAEYGYQAYLTEGERATGHFSRACLALPLRRGDQVQGVLSVQSLEPGVLTEEHLALLSMWAGPIAIALDNARMVEELRRQTVELQMHNAELDAFAHTVAHDIKNPLQIVLGYAQSSLTRYAQLSEETHKSNLRGIVRAGQKLDSIVEELLLLAGVRQMAAVDLCPLDMTAIVAEARERLAELIENYHAEIRLPTQWPVARGYGPWVEEVWTNYLSNAIKYGGQPPRLELGAAPDSHGQVRFWVRDNGAGIPADEQARLFTPFERLGQVRASGYGLGLSIVRRISEKLGGRVGVESEIDRGSTFYFTLPADKLGEAP